MRLAEVMTRGVHTVSAAMSATDAWELMRRRRIHHLVVAHDAEIVGVVSDRDLGGRHGARVRAGYAVSDLMTLSVVTLEPNAPVRKAANLMRGRSIGCIPVVQNEHLVGIVTVSDLLGLVERRWDHRTTASQRTPRHRVFHRPQHRPAERSREPAAAAPGNRELLSDPSAARPG
jgi:acetoin utilization protein AcuB